MGEDQPQKEPIELVASRKASRSVYLTVHGLTQSWPVAPPKQCYLYILSKNTCENDLTPKYIVLVLPNAKPEGPPTLAAIARNAGGSPPRSGPRS